MKRALVLSSGAAWGAFHIGALEYLVTEHAYHFDICAGTGIGALNAAFVACGEFAALNEFWSRIGWLKLISFNWKHPFRDGLFTGKPQKKFIQKYISVDKLGKNNRKLVISALNLSTGQQSYFTYPGADIPIEDALMAALTVPGLASPYKYLGDPLVEGTFGNSFILSYIMNHHRVDEYYGVAALPTGDEKHLEKRRYKNWRKAFIRTLQVNLSRDIRHEIEKVENRLQAVRADHQLKNVITEKIENEISDTHDRQVILDGVSQYFQKQDNLQRKSDAVLYAIISEKEVESPLWSFRKKNVDLLKKEGYKIAKKIRP